MLKDNRQTDKSKQLKKKSDQEFYGLNDSEANGWKNKVQRCLAMMPIPKFNRDSNIFTTYEVLLGARIYQDRSDSNPKNLSERTIEVTVDPPTYEERKFDETQTKVPDGIEKDLKNLKDEKKESYKIDSNNRDRKIKSEVFVDF